MQNTNNSMLRNLIIVVLSASFGLGSAMLYDNYGREFMANFSGGLIGFLILAVPTIVAAILIIFGLRSLYRIIRS
ncbi:hypothetical protein THIOSC15_2640009 [uncultured Thiomicrorhabdus sp.]